MRTESAYIMTAKGTDAKKPIAAILLAFFLAIGIGAWVGLSKRAARLDAEMARAVTGGARLAGDLFRRDLESMKQAALTLPQATEFSHGILLWVDLQGGKDGASAIAATMVNPAWKLAPGELSAVQSEFLPAATRAVNNPARWREIRRGRTEFIRVKNWVSFAFSTSQTAPALGANFGGGAVIVLVDPAQAFPSVASVGTGLSSFLATSDGYVLSHSTSALDGAEIGATQEFQAAAQALLRASAGQSSPGALRSFATGAFVKSVQAENGGAVALAAARVPTLPLYLVVEKQLRAQAPTVQAASAKHPTAPGRSLMATVLLGVLIGFVLYLIQKIREATAAAQSARETLNAHAQREHLRELREIQAFEEERTREEHRAAEEVRQLEEARKREEESKLRTFEQELVGQFEIEVVKEQAPKRIAYSVTQLAHRLCQAPALFFAFQPLTRKAFLSATAGLPRAVSKAPFQFELSDLCLKKIKEADQRGESLALSDYLPLSSVLQLNFHAPRSRSWALTGTSRFLGVLVVLEQGDDLPIGEWIPSSLKTACRQYEKALTTH